MCRFLATPVLVLLIFTTALWSQPSVSNQPVPGIPKPRLDRHGHPLPANALDRLGTLQLWHAFQTFSLAFSPDGKTLVSGGDDGKIRVWDRLTGKETQCFEMDQFSVDCVRFSPDGKRLAFARGAVYGGTFGLLDLQSGKVVHDMFAGKWPVHSLLFTPDGKTLVAGDYA